MDQKTKNMIGVLQAVALYGQQHKWSALRTRRMGRCAIMCVMTEGGGQMYANSGVPRSLKLPHDAVGRDHDSVGLFQQRVSWDGKGGHGWGDVNSAMDIKRSTFQFLDHMEDRRMTAYTLPKGVRGYDGRTLIKDLADRVQNVQVSWYDGNGGRKWGQNYRNNAKRSLTFTLKYWIPGTFKIRSSKSYL